MRRISALLVTALAACQGTVDVVAEITIEASPEAEAALSYPLVVEYGVSPDPFGDVGATAPQRALICGEDDPLPAVLTIGQRLPGPCVDDDRDLHVFAEAFPLTDEGDCAAIDVEALELGAPAARAAAPAWAPIEYCGFFSDRVTLTLETAG